MTRTTIDTETLTVKIADDFATTGRFGGWRGEVDGEQNFSAGDGDFLVLGLNAAGAARVRVYLSVLSVLRRLPSLSHYDDGVLEATDGRRWVVGDLDEPEADPAADLLSGAWIHVPEE